MGGLWVVFVWFVSVCVCGCVLRVLLLYSLVLLLCVRRPMCGVAHCVVYGVVCGGVCCSCVACCGVCVLCCAGCLFCVVCGASVCAWFVCFVMLVLFALGHAVALGLASTCVERQCAPADGCASSIGHVRPQHGQHGGHKARRLRSECALCRKPRRAPAGRRSIRRPLRCPMQPPQLCLGARALHRLSRRPTQRASRARAVHAPRSSKLPLLASAASNAANV